MICNRPPYTLNLKFIHLSLNAWHFQQSIDMKRKEERNIFNFLRGGYKNSNQRKIILRWELRMWFRFSLSCYARLAFLHCLGFSAVCLFVLYVGVLNRMPNFYLFLHGVKILRITFICSSSIFISLRDHLISNLLLVLF